MTEVIRPTIIAGPGGVTPLGFQTPPTSINAGAAITGISARDGLKSDQWDRSNIFANSFADISAQDSPTDSKTKQDLLDRIAKQGYQKMQQEFLNMIDSKIRMAMQYAVTDPLAKVGILMSAFEDCEWMLGNLGKDFNDKIPNDMKSLQMRIQGKQNQIQGMLQGSGVNAKKLNQVAVSNGLNPFQITDAQRKQMFKGVDQVVDNSFRQVSERAGQLIQAAKTAQPGQRRELLNQALNVLQMGLNAVGDNAITGSTGPRAQIAKASDSAKQGAARDRVEALMIQANEMLQLENMQENNAL